MIKISEQKKSLEKRTKFIDLCKIVHLIIQIH